MICFLVFFQITRKLFERMFVCLLSEYDTDEETDKLLGVEHRINVKNQAIRDAVRS